jgi:urea ABC transporter permease protein UrtC
MSDGIVRSAIGRIRSPFEGPNTMGNSGVFWVVFFAVVAYFWVYPQLIDPYTVSQTTKYLALAVLGLSLSFVWGYSGILSFGQVAFFGVAAYTFGIISINLSSAVGKTAGMLGAVAVGTLFALVLGYFMFYGGVRATYVTIITLVVALVLNTFMAQTAGSEWAIGSARLGGFNGMNTPDLVVGFGSTSVQLSGGSPELITTYYHFVLAALVVTYLALRVLVNSSFGMTMVAIREDEDRTATFGYNVPFIKLVVFTIGGALASLGGVLYVNWGSFIDPSVFAITFAALPVVWVSVGGRESLIGVMGATFAIEQMRTSLSAAGTEWAQVIVGAMLLVVILVIPSGIAPLVDRLFKWALSRLLPYPDESAGKPAANKAGGDD